MRIVSLSVILFVLLCQVPPESIAAAMPAGEFRQRLSTTDEVSASDVAEEVRFGREVAARIIGRFGLYEDRELMRYVNLVGSVLSRSSNRPELEFRFAVLNTDEINAYAAPGGYIFITRGAVAQMRDEAELAGVLAHEIGHVVERHAVKELHIRGSDRSVTSGIAAIIGGGSQPARAAFAQAVDQALDTLFRDGYRRSDEAQADRDAVLYCALAGYEPSGLVRYFERLGQAKGERTAVLDRTHPPYEVRIAWLKKDIAWEGLEQENARRYEERFVKFVRQLH